MNIIGDVAGRFDELMELLKIMPQDEKIILVGDIIDRGPKSKEVCDWAMNNPNVIVLKGNHEDMATDDPLLHYSNGGNTTLKSFGVEHHRDIPNKYIQWFLDLPIFYKEDGLFISHAPWDRNYELGEYNPVNVLWNRTRPKSRKGIFQIHGHNTVMTIYDDYGICIDDSGHDKLSGIHWPSKKVFQVDYLRNE